MNLDELLNTAGISKEDLTTFVAPIIKEAIVTELGPIIEEVVKREITPTVETLPGLVKTYVDQQIGLVVDEIKAVKSKVNERVDEQVSKVVKVNPSQGTDDNKGIPQEYKMKLLDKFIDKALGGDEDQMVKTINKVIQQQKLLNESLAAAGIYQPGPEYAFKIQADTIAKMLSWQLKAGIVPLPVVDGTRKPSPVYSSHQSGLKRNTSKATTGGFDRFLKKP